MGQLGNIIVVGLLTLASGLLDARGFVYASRAWPGGQLDLKMGLVSLACFVGGLTAYILSIAVAVALCWLISTTRAAAA